MDKTNSGDVPAEGRMFSNEEIIKIRKAMEESLAIFKGLQIDANDIKEHINQNVSKAKDRMDAIESIVNRKKKELSDISEAQLKLMDEKITTSIGLLEKRIKETYEKANAQVLDRNIFKANMISYSNFFENQASENKQSRRKWIYATIVMVALAFLSIIITSQKWFYELNSENVYLTLSGKLIIVTLFTSGAIWCGRMYRAMTNQQLINSHRMLNAETMIHYTNSELDAETRNAILLRAAVSLFQHAPTGLVGEPENNVSLYDMSKQLHSRISED